MSCYYLVSHGGYFQNNKKNFKIPDNIRLIQYTTPGSTLTNHAVSKILKSSCSSTSIPKSVPKDFYIVTDEGHLLREELVKKNLEPGVETVDIILTFGKDVAGIPLGVYKKENNQDVSIIINNKEEVSIWLSDYLKMLSKAFKELFRYKDTVVIHQLSCRSEFEEPEKDEEPEKNKLKKIPVTNSDLDEIIRSFKSNRIVDAPALFRTDKKFFNKKVVLYTDDKEKAKEKAVPLWRKNTLKNASVKRKNETLKKIKEDRHLENYKSLFKNPKKHSYEDKKKRTTKRTTKRKTKKITNPFLKYLFSTTG